MDEQWKQLLMIVLVFAAGIAVGVMLSENYAKDLARETCGTCINNYNLLVNEYNKHLATRGAGLIGAGIANATDIWKAK